jgi:hypothetical protein
MSEPNTYRRLGNDHYLTGPDFFAKSADGFTWSPIKEDEYARDLAAYEMAHQPKPKPRFTLSIYRARPSRSTIWDMVATALMAACWMAVLFGFYLLMK